MVIAHCTRCLGKAQGKTFEEASCKINHAVSLSRGIPCGDNYNCVVEVKEKSTKIKPPSTNEPGDKIDQDIDVPPKDLVKSTNPKKLKKQ